VGLASREGHAVKQLLIVLAAVPALCLRALASPAPTTNGPTVVLVVGAPGESEFGSNFLHQAEVWEQVGTTAGARTIRIGPDTAAGTSDHDRLRAALADEATNGLEALWLVLIGHGTFDGKEARFNLQGPDVSDTELADWLRPFRRPVLVINTASSSAPFLTKLSTTNGVVLTATRSGHEQNYARFGSWFAEALADPQSDLDKDGQVSLLEAFLMASRRVAEFYKSEGRLATEHALIDDNGDGLGTPADWFRGVRATRKAAEGAALDGARAHQFHLVLSPEEQALPPEVRARRDSLELAVVQLRESKSKLSEEDYYRQLEVLLLELAHLQEGDGAARTKSGGP
jgi:hypothetical protein